MGNKKTKKRNNPAGTHNTKRSKGTGHENPNSMLHSDWSKLLNRLYALFGLLMTLFDLLNMMVTLKMVIFIENWLVRPFFDQKKCKKLLQLPGILLKLSQVVVERMNKYVKPLRTI